MRPITRVKFLAKRALIHSRLALLLLPLRQPMIFLVYLTDSIRWCLRASRIRPARVFDTRDELYGLVSGDRLRDEPINYLEFGVWTGASLRWWLRHNGHPDSRFVGFDTFTGLPESWGYYDKHHFDTKGKPPEVGDSRASFRVGLFQETLEDFVQQNELKHRTVINIDADLYSSTHFVLGTLARRLKPGDVILFDEFLAWRTPADQFRAFIDFVGSFYVDYRFVGAARNFEKLAVEVVRLSKDGGRGRMIAE